MWNGKNKAVTFSFDDGVTQDKRLIEIFNKYGLKCTFNLNSSFLGLLGQVETNNRKVMHNKIRACEVKEVYAGHEVAVHTLTHPSLPTLDDETIKWQVEEDRKALERLVGYKVRGMAYPGGGVNNDDRVRGVLERETEVKYARTIKSTYGFDMPKDLLRLDPSVFYTEKDKMFEMAKEFISLKTDEPKMFYIWGHSYEMDAEWISWERFEEFCKMISGKDDIFYGTNSEVLLK